MSAASGKKLSVFIAALNAGVACLVSFAPLTWLIGNSYRDPARTFAEDVNLSSYTELDPLYLIAALGAVTAYVFLFSSARIIAGANSRGIKLANQFAIAVWFAVSALNFLFAGEDLSWFKVDSYLLIWNSYYATLLVLTLISFAIWAALTWRWTGLETARTGLRYSSNGAIAILLLSIPGHVIASEGGGFLVGLGTFLATYFSIQVLIVIGVCGLWMRRHAPREEGAPDNMHEAASRYALRESVMLVSAAFFLLILSYSIYPFFYRDRFTVAMLGQNGFCVFAVCAVARGVKGYLLRASRPFWILGLYMLLAEVALLVAWKLVVPAVV